MSESIVATVSSLSDGASDICIHAVVNRKKAKAVATNLGVMILIVSPLYGMVAEAAHPSAALSLIHLRSEMHFKKMAPSVGFEPTPSRSLRLRVLYQLSYAGIIAHFNRCASGGRDLVLSKKWRLR
jgi:hypothetical protein